jgi:hypothetical protein
MTKITIESIKNSTLPFIVLFSKQTETKEEFMKLEKKFTNLNFYMEEAFEGFAKK